MSPVLVFIIFFKFYFVVNQTEHSKESLLKACTGRKKPFFVLVPNCLLFQSDASPNPNVGLQLRYVLQPRTLTKPKKQDIILIYIYIYIVRRMPNKIKE